MDIKMQQRLKWFMEANPTGGNLHIVMEDGNLEDHHIQWCLTNALDEGDGEAAVLAHWLLKQSEEDREYIYNKNW